MIGNACYRLLIIFAVFSSIAGYNMKDQIISYGQLDIKPEILSFEYLNGTLYYNYENSAIHLAFRYPAKWHLTEFKDEFASGNKVISLEPYSSGIYKQGKINNYYPNYLYSYFPWTFNILSYKLNFNNITMEEFVKIKIQDLQILFSDFKFTSGSSNIIYIGRENIPGWKFEYSIADPYSSVGSPSDKRYGMSIWILNGNKVYEFEYISSQQSYLKNIDDVSKLIGSIRIL